MALKTIWLSQSEAVLLSKFRKSWRIRTKDFPNPVPKQALVFAFKHYKSFENTLRKGEIARNICRLGKGYRKIELFSSYLKLSSVLNLQSNPDKHFPLLYR